MPLQARSLRCDRHDRVPGLMPTTAAVHHKERLPRIVSGPSHLPPRGFMSRGILKRYHVSLGKSVKSLMGAGAKRLAVFLHCNMTRLARLGPPGTSAFPPLVGAKRTPIGEC